MVYVLNIDGNPLMPTERLGRVRHLLKERKAVIYDLMCTTDKMTIQLKADKAIDMTIPAYGARIWKMKA